MSADAASVWREILRSQGVSEVELDRAQRTGTLELLALERTILREPPEYDVVEAAARAGVEPDDIRRFWRALGFPDPRAGERIFNRTDVEMLTMVAQLLVEGTLEEELALQMSRVIGSSLARIATAQVEAAQLRQDATAAADDEVSQAREVERSAQLVPMLSTVLDSVWRRHLAVATGKRIARSSQGEDHRPITVGFADLEGFTALAQQLPERDLASVVNRFETIAYDAISGLNGRLVKTIGDEVMFTAEDARHGAELALTLAESYAEDDVLSDVRVGLACGQAIELEGDVYGPAVNLASRIVSIAYPGSVVVSPEIEAALADDPAFRFRKLRSHVLKNIGRVRLFVVRRSGPEEDEEEGVTLSRARERRARRRQWISENIGGPGDDDEGGDDDDGGDSYEDASGDR